MTLPAVDFSDVQGLLRFGFGKLTDASFRLLNIRDVAATRAWLSTAPVTSAVILDQAPQNALQIAFSSQGLRALQLPDAVLTGFSAEFLAGMNEESRSRRLGDVEASSPHYWRWGAPGKVPHLVLLLYAQQGQLEAWTQAVKGPRWDVAFEELAILPTSNLFGAEPFGFADGISQPVPDWQRQRQIKGDQLSYGNVTALGEFLLGYPNEYNKYTDRPLLNASDPSSTILSPAEDAPDKRDLGRNGTYLVFRQLRQDVRGFWRFLNQQTNSDLQLRQALAEAMVGRKMEGDPLLPLSSEPIAGIDPKTAAQNQFTYDADDTGTCCPFGAHIRRANPRNADMPSGVQGFFSWAIHTLGFGSKKFRSDVMASTRFHRLLRRGREYGPPLTPEQAVADQPDTGEHGIQFICLGANISRQFEFVQSSWIMSTKFNAMTEESDPLLGNRTPTPGCPFTVPQESGLRTRITGMPQFITVVGGAYFFLPSLSAIRYLASLRG
jgi:deferrochelatase/peroxidase EfeB